MVVREGLFCKVTAEHYVKQRDVQVSREKHQVASGRENSKCKGHGAVGAEHRRVDWRVGGQHSCIYSLMQQWLLHAGNARMERSLM